MPPYSKPPIPDWLSKQQRDVVQCVQGERCHIVVNAGAGTGKTTLGIECLKALSPGTSAAMLAFNKPIADYMATLVPSGVKACTFHSLSYASVRQQWPFLAGQGPNTDRTWEMLPESIPGSTRRLICRLVSICKNQLVDGTDKQQLLDLCVQYDIDLYQDSEGNTQWANTEDTVLSVTPEILYQSKTPTPVTGIDFDDMLWLPVVWQLPVRKYDFIVVDESQDTNKVQKELLFMALRQAGRLMVVGDRRQAIYAFRGADATSMDDLFIRLQDTPQGAKEFPLTVTRRCPILVVALARTIVPNFDYPLENTVWEQ